MRYREYRPSANLARFVECFWYLRTRGNGSWESIYPDGSTELLLNLQRPAEELRGCAVVPQPRYFAYGQIDRRLEVRNATTTEVIAIRFRPWGATPLLGVPAARYAGTSVPLDAMSEALNRRLACIVEAAAPVGRKVKWLDRSLSEWIRRHDPDVPETAPLIRYLQATPSATLSDILQLTGWSARTAQRRFRSDIGLSPKRFTQITRFMRFTRLAHRATAAPTSELALDAGYYDQSHLHRDLRRFAATTPASFRDRTAQTFDALYGGERLAQLVAV